MRLSVAWAIALTQLGCSGNAGHDPPPVVEAAACAPGEWRREDGACIPAGLPPDMPCPPGEWLRDDGECIPAGVPPDGCGEGFAHDGDRGCEPILPSEACPPGLMAVPGEMRCREVAPCGAGQWGNIPVEPNTQYVDASHSGNSDGSALNPWTSIQDAVDAADPGAIVAVAAGSYPEDVDVAAKSVRLSGACPALVEIVGSAAGLAAFMIWPDASGTVVQNLAIRGNAKGIWSYGARDVELERVWVHDTAGWGVEGELGPVTLRNSLVEHTHEIGVFIASANLTVDASVVRDTEVNRQGLFGRGIHARADMTAGIPSTLRVQGSLVERNHEVGVYVSGSEATVAASVIRDTKVNGQGTAGMGVVVRPNPVNGASSKGMLERSVVERSYEAGVSAISSEVTLDASVVRDTQPNGTGLFGRGLTIQSDATAVRATLLVKRSLIEQCGEDCVFVGGSDATVEASVVRGTQPDVEFDGGGIVAIPDPMTGAPATLLLLTSLVEQNHEAGMRILGSQATVEASHVRDTLLDERGIGGIGVIAAPYSAMVAPSTLLLRTSLIERSHEIGLFVVASEATIETSVIRATQPNARELGGRGSNVQAYRGIPATVLFRGVLIEESQELGVAVVGAIATIESSRVRGTASGSQSLFGDGVIVIAELGPASATIVDTRVEQSARAAISAHGAHVEVGNCALTCQAFDIDYETFLGTPTQIDNLGGNLCGCPEPTETCKAVSAGLAPPPTLEPPAPP